MTDTYIRDLEDTVSALRTEMEELRIELLEARLANASMVARLRVVELMEQQAANRLGFQIPVRPVEEETGHSLRVVER